MINKVLLISFLFFTIQLNGQQNKTYSEEEIKAQTSFLEARIKLYKKDTVSAIKMFKDIYDQSSMSMAVWELSKIYKEQKDYSEAERYALKVSSDMNTKEVFLQYMLSLYSISENEVLYKSTLENLIEYYPENDGYFYNLVDELIKQEAYNKALKLLNKIQNEEGVKEEIAKRKYSIYVSLGKNKKAEKSLISLVDKYPKEILYLYNLATFYSQTKEISKLKKVYNRILELNPDDKNAQMVLKTNDSTSSENTGLRALLPLIENPKTDIDAIIKRLIPYVENINEEKDSEISKTILLLCEKLAFTNPDDAKSNSIYADVLYLMGDLEKSKLQYIKTLEINKSVFSVWNQTFLVLNRLKDYKSLIKYTELAQEYYPNQATIYIYNSIGHAMNENFMEAKDILVEAKYMINSSDNFTKQLNIIAQISILLKTDQIVEAKKGLREFETNKDKLSFEILEKLSELYHLLNDFEKSDSFSKLSISKGNLYLKSINNVEK